MTVQSLATEFDNFRKESNLDKEFKLRQYHEEMEEVVKYMGLRKFKIFVEIGTDEGVSLWIYYNSLCTKNSTIIGIEPNVKEQYKFTCKKMKERFKNFRTIEKNSIDAIDDVPNNIDLLHIDGSHATKDVLNDYKIYSK